MEWNEVSKNEKNLIKGKLSSYIFLGIVCVVCFILSLAFSHGAGNYIFTLFDNFAGSVPLLVIALAECLAVAYVYGLKR